jgi:hypothetical protein
VLKINPINAYCSATIVDKLSKNCNLYKEITLYSMLSEIDWLRLQINFLEQHHFFSNTAIQTRKEKKKE